MRRAYILIVLLSILSVLLSAVLLAVTVERIRRYEMAVTVSEQTEPEAVPATRRELPCDIILLDTEQAASEPKRSFGISERLSSQAVMQPDEEAEPELTLIDSFIATAYCDHGTTATGTTTTEGRTLAVNPADIPYGSHVWLFTEDGELIGDYYAEDTGGNLLRQHWIVDIYMPEYEDCIEWGARRVTVYADRTD